MAEPSAPLCITCSLPVSEPLRLNHLPSGQTCPTCRDRLLAALPPVLPARAGVVQGSELEGGDDRREGKRRRRSR